MKISGHDVFVGASGTVATFGEELLVSLGKLAFAVISAVIATFVSSYIRQRLEKKK